MKTLFLMRHAKSDWSNSLKEDVERGLNARGKKDASKMCTIIQSFSKDIDHIYVSTAERAKKTVESLADYYKEKVSYTDRLYTFTGTDSIQFVKALPQDYESVLLVGHNPSLEFMVSFIIHADFSTVKIPTAALLKLEIEVKSWD